MIDHHDEQEDGGQRRPDSLVVPISGQLDCVETEEVINVELGQGKIHSLTNTKLLLFSFSGLMVLKY